MLDAVGLAGHDPADGRELWRHPFMTFNGINVCQPLVLPGDQLFVSAGYDAGSQLIKVGQTDNIWQAETVWRSKGMKCKMSSCVYLDGYIYGFDDGILACLDARDGKRNWKGGRYGHGQLLLRDRVLVIQAESGEFVLAAADPKKHRELLKIPALEGGKAWNAPAMAGDLVLLRNHFEAVLYQLPLDNQ
jgi:outer membrane protein assembly factor BamB